MYCSRCGAYNPDDAVQCQGCGLDLKPAEPIPSGNVWIANYANSTVSEITGATKGPQYFPYKGPVFPGGGNI